MPVTVPRKVTAEKSPQPQPPPTTLARKDFLRILRRARVPEETIKATDEQLQDPIDLERDAVFLDSVGSSVAVGRRPAHGSTHDGIADWPPALRLRPRSRSRGCCGWSGVGVVGGPNAGQAESERCTVGLTTAPRTTGCQ